jgi:hypothetical protein
VKPNATVSVADDVIDTARMAKFHMPASRQRAFTSVMASSRW